MDLERIATMSARECIRQEVGLYGLKNLMTAYSYAHRARSVAPDDVDLMFLAERVEPIVNKLEMNSVNYRKTPVVFNNGGYAVDHTAIPGAMVRLSESLKMFWDSGVTYTDRDINRAVKAFLDIHPFVDGNGRVAFILYNWLKRTLDSPYPLPDYYGEESWLV